MANTLMGCIVDDEINSAGGDNTLIFRGTPADYNVTAPFSGVFRSVTLRIAVVNTAVAKIKAFYDDGTNYVFISESRNLGALSLGDSTHEIWVPVFKGVVFGWYLDGGQVDANAAAGGTSIHYRAGDITTTTTKASWTTLTTRDDPSINVSLFSKAILIG